VKKKEPTECSPTPVVRSLEMTTPCCCDSSPTSSDNNSTNGSSSSSNAIRRVPNVFSQIERLESYDSDMLRPLLMYNIENIQQLRAD
jgi:hypothetical protein